MTKSGPAHTLRCRGVYDYEEIEFDVDLVPCFVFDKDSLPFALNDRQTSLFGPRGSSLVSKYLKYLISIQYSISIKFIINI